MTSRHSASEDYAANLESVSGFSRLMRDWLLHYLMPAASEPSDACTVWFSVSLKSYHWLQQQ
jgi:hypothetical protein